VERSIDRLREQKCRPYAHFKLGKLLQSGGAEGTGGSYSWDKRSGGGTPPCHRLIRQIQIS
jgi:hypothetical protein